MRADLHDAAGGARGVHHRAALEDGVADRLFHIDVGASLDGRDEGQGVPVVGRGDDGDLRFRALKQLTVVLEHAGLGAGALAYQPERGFELA